MAGKENPGSISSSMAGVAIPVRHQAWSQHPNLTPNQELGPCPPAKPSRPGRVEDGRGSSAPFPVPAHQTGRADFPHPAFRLVSPRAYDGRSMRALFAPPLHLGTAVKLAWKAPGLMPCFVGSRQVTDPRLLQQAHQKSGPFPPLALPSLGSTTTLSDPHLCRRLSASLRPLPSPMMGLPRLPVSPFQRAVPTTPADQGGCACRLLPRLRGLPRYSGGSASATSLSRPAQSSLTLRPAGLLNRPRRPSSRGFDLTSYPTKPLVSYQINRQLSGWILPPLVIRAVGAHRMIQAAPGKRSLAGKRPAPDSQSTSRITLTRHCSIRPWPLSRSVWVSTAPGAAAAKQASTSARKVGWLALAASRYSAPASLIAVAMVPLVTI